MADSDDDPQVELSDDEEDLETAYREAAEALAQADVFYLVTGAGFSADSGLAVYKDIAEIAPYAERGLKYHDLCVPDLLEYSPDLYYGFWGACYNDYRQTEPHAGYGIIARWCQDKFRETTCSDNIRQRIRARRGEAPGQEGGEPYDVEGEAGAFYMFTSNVDAHSFDHFEACEVRECHGNVEMWQCAASTACSERIWRAPLDYRFDVDLATMVAAQSPVAEQSQDQQVEVGEEATPRVGRIKHTGRPQMLQKWPDLSGPQIDLALKSFGGAPNRPVCPQCGGPARPAILMFGDCGWTDNEAQERRYSHWLKAVEEEVRERKEEGETLRICVLDIGCGNNVPTCRWNSQLNTRRFQRVGASCTHVRINLDLPGADRGPGPLPAKFVSIKGKALESLQRIDAEYQKLKAATDPEPQ